MKYIYLLAIFTLCLSCLRTSEDLTEEQSRNRNRMNTPSTMKSGTMVEGDCRQVSYACVDGFVCMKLVNGYECVLSDNNTGTTAGTQAGTTASDNDFFYILFLFYLFCRDILQS